MNDTWGSFAAFSRNTSLLSKTIRFTWKHFDDGIDHGDDDYDDDDDVENDDDKGDDDVLICSRLDNNFHINENYESEPIVNVNFLLKYQSV